MDVTLRSHQLWGAGTRGRHGSCLISHPGWIGVTLPLPDHSSGFPYKPPLIKWDLHACPRGWGQWSWSGGQGNHWHPWDDAALVSLGCSLQPSWLPIPTMTASPLAPCCSFPDAYRCVLSEAWTDGCKQLSVSGFAQLSCEVVTDPCVCLYWGRWKIP